MKTKASRTGIAAPAAAAVVAAAVLFAPSRAAAEERVGRRAIADEMRGYYGAERDTAFLFMGIGVASVAGGSVLATRDGDFERGLGWSLVAVGGLETLGSLFYAVQVGSEIDRYSASLAKNPGVFKIEEGEHIHGTTSRFFWYRTGELVLAGAGVGMAIYGFAADEDVWKGVGIGVAAEALTFFVLDGFGQSRAKEYEKKILRFEPGLASLSMSGTF